MFTIPIYEYSILHIFPPSALPPFFVEGEEEGEEDYFVNIYLRVVFHLVFYLEKDDLT